MSGKLRDNGLSIALAALFLLFMGAQTLMGYRVDQDDRREHGQPAVSFPQYVRSPHFLEATMENWESEFLQMFVFVLLSVYLVQRGSAESKKPEDEDEDDAEEQRKAGPDSPWPVRKGGAWLKLYDYSLSIAFALMFLVAFWLHAVGGAGEFSEEQLAHGGQAVSTLAYLGTSRFWFESFQNWQSEFLAILAMVVLTIFLRQRGSPQSKPVEAPHHETGA